MKVVLSRKKIVFLICVASTKKEFRKDPLGCYELMLHMISDIFSGIQLCGFFPTISSYMWVKCHILVPDSSIGTPGILSGVQICHLWRVQPLTMAILSRPLKMADSQQLGEGWGCRKRRMGYWYWERGRAESGCVGLLGQPLTEINADQENQEKHDIWKEFCHNSGHHQEYDYVQYKLTHFRFFRHCISFVLRL